MKDCSQSSLEESRPRIAALDGINFSLQQLYKDDTKNISDEIVARFTFEELIGILLLARDELEARSSENDE